MFVGIKLLVSAPVAHPPVAGALHVGSRSPRGAGSVGSAPQRFPWPAQSGCTSLGHRRVRLCRWSQRPNERSQNPPGFLPGWSGWWLTGWPTPLKNMWLRQYDDIPNIYIYIYMENHIKLPEKGGRKPALSPNFLFPQRNVVVAAMIEIITPNVLLQSRMNRSPNHLQHLWKTSPCFATFRPPLPQYNFSFPCKLFYSEPQRTLLSVELRSFLHFAAAFNDFPSYSFVCSNLFPAVPPLSSVFLLCNLP